MYLNCNQMLELLHKMHAQCARADLDKLYLTRTKDYRSMKTYTPYLDLKSVRIEIPNIGFHYVYSFFKNWFLLIQKQFSVIKFKLILLNKRVPDFNSC